MTFTDAAAEVLRLVGKPLHYKEITDIAIEKNLLSHVGKSPEVTMGARLAATLKKDSSENPLVRVKPGVFALREWDEKTIKSGLEPKKAGKKGASPRSEPPPAKDHAPKEDDDDEVLIAGDEPEEEAAVAADDDSADEIFEAPLLDDDAAPAPIAAVPVASPSRAAQPRITQDDGPPGPDEAMRNEAAAGAAEMFDEEEDDDQPILGATIAPPRRPARSGRTGVAVAAAAAAVAATGRPLRRGPGRRRHRGQERRAAVVHCDAGLVRAAPRSRRSQQRPRPGRGSRRGSQQRPRRRRGPPRRRRESTYRGPQVIELTGGEGHALDDLAGRELSDAIAIILSTFDRNAGAVSLRQIAETAQRRGRLSGDAQLDAVAGRRRGAGRQLAPHRLGAAASLPARRRARGAHRLAALGRPRSPRARGARRRGALPRRRSPRLRAQAGRAARPRLRRDLRPRPREDRHRPAPRRAPPALPAGETHLSGVLRAAGGEVRLAIVIRRDGREVGRERVTELRGSLHHYGNATVGWIFTAGQMLSGAREEAATAGTPPIALHDGLAVARLCEDNDVAVIRARLPIAIPDVDLLRSAPRLLKHRRLGRSARVSERLSFSRSRARSQASRATRG